MLTRCSFADQNIMIEIDRTALCEAISARLPEQGSRLLVAIVGAPASGKSTQAALLSRQLNEQHKGAMAPVSIVVPMDGFHLDNSILEQEGQMARKGSPATFDATGLLHLLQRIKQQDAGQSSLPLANAIAKTDPPNLSNAVDSSIAFPVFDRSLDLSRAAADRVLPEHRCIIVEGNYLLLQQPPWHSLRELFDITVMLDVPQSTLSERLIERWLSHGESLQMARSRTDKNDLPNARTVISNSSKADFLIRNS